SPQLERPFFRVAPHLIDTILLASAVLLAVIVRQYPFVNAWLTAKVVGLVAYVVLGSLAIRRGRTPRVRALAFAGALLSVAYIVGTALHHDPNPGHW
ncbi:MAG: SirB2 family protein, partial [Proteobacteria bacterium]|nr:SirB2 family protein [Pseudomonadota bacterium]